MLRHAAFLALCFVLTVIGVVGGWYAARQGAGGAGAADPHAGGEAAPVAGQPEIDDRTLANMGVRIEPAKLSTFTRYRSVQAVIEDRPHNLQTVIAPLGGIVTAVKAEEGGAADAGEALLVLVRDPIPRPKPDLTAEVLKPISEEVHGSIAELRKALGQRAIVDANLARVLEARKGRDGGIVILRRSEIEYQNQRASTNLTIEAARRELQRHGLTEEDIAKVEAGERPPANATLWQHALEHAGLWPQTANEIRAAVPEADRGRSWCVAAIGELAAHGLAKPALVEALRADPEMGAHFAEVAGLLLEGTPLEMVKTLAKAGALHESTVLRAPAGVDRWDVQRVHVRPGRRVTSGDVLMELHDARTMWLRLEPVGVEIGHVVRALGEGTLLEARPLVPASGPVLHDLRLKRMATFAEASASGGRGYAEAVNSRLCPAGESVACSWKLRVGLRYVVRVPVQELIGRFVFPSGAVTNEGPNRVVYVRDGETFRSQRVTVEYEDDEVTVVKDDGGIFADDPVAMSGAFALSLALTAETATFDPHAGHSH